MTIKQTKKQTRVCHMLNCGKKAVYYFRYLITDSQKFSVIGEYCKKHGKTFKNRGAYEQQMTRAECIIYAMLEA